MTPPLTAIGQRNLNMVIYAYHYYEKMFRDIPHLKAEFFRTLAHPLRIRVLELLAPGEQPFSALLARLDVEQPHLSQHLGVLRRAGFVTSRRESSTVVYSLADERIVELLGVSKRILLDQLTMTRDELHAS